MKLTTNDKMLQEEEVMKVSKAQLKSQEKYDAQNTIRMNIKLNKKTDADIIELLEKAPSKNGLIREALRQMLKKD